MSAITSSSSIQKPPFVIKRQIPASNIKISFTIQQNQQGKVDSVASVTLAIKQKEEIPNAPIEAFSKDTTNITLSNALEMFQKNAIDYICGKVIFLPSDALPLFKEWNLNKTTRSPEAHQNRKEYINKMKRHGKNLEAPEKCSKKIVDAYHWLGNEFLYSFKYYKALFLFQLMFTKAKELKDSDGLRLAHRNLGMVYYPLGENKRALKHHMKELELAREVASNEVYKACLSLGNVFESMGDKERALSYFLEFQKGCKSDYEIALSYSNLGNSCLDFCKYEDAEKLFQKSLEILETKEALNGLTLVYFHQGYYAKAIKRFEDALKKTSLDEEKGEIFTNIGLCYGELNSNQKACEFHNKSLEIAKKLSKRELEVTAYTNLVKSYIESEDYEAGLAYVKEIMSLQKYLNDRQLTAIVWCFLGDFHFVKEEYKQSADCHSKHLKIATEIQDVNGQINAANNLARTYAVDKRYKEAIELYLKAINWAEEINDREALAPIKSNLARIYYFAANLVESTKLFQESIEIYSALQRENCKDNLQWQVSLFEAQFRPYRCLEQTLLAQNQRDEALLLADSSRAKALVNLLERKSNRSCKLSLDLVKTLANQQKTTIVMYSCNPFDDNKAWCWVVCPKRNINYQTLTISETSRQMPAFGNKRSPVSRSAHEELKGEELQKAISVWSTEFEVEACRGDDDLPTPPTESFEIQLKGWYQDFITPIEQWLPKNGERLTIIPDEFLHDLPFTIFKDPKGRYLFESCTLITAPSMEGLLYIESLNEQHRASRMFNDMCVLANPNPNREFGLPKLENVEEEGREIERFFDNTTKINPKIEELKSNFTKVGHIHLACHGLPTEKENLHSVFEGALDLTTHLLYTENIVTLPLNAELAFLSACHSGKGKVYKEGAVGLPFAFLAAGAASVISTRWQVYDKTTPCIVAEFYRHYRGQSSAARAALKAGKPFGQAEALREALLFAKQKYPNKSYVWGSFFLTGLPGNIPKIELEGKPVIWEDKTHKVQFQWAGEQVVATVFKKDSESTSQEFSEDNILVHMLRPTDSVKGQTQKKRTLSKLEKEEKIALLKSIPDRQITLCNGKMEVEYKI